MSERDSFDDLPILAELRARLADEMRGGAAAEPVRPQAAGWAAGGLRLVPVVMAVAATLAVAGVAFALLGHRRAAAPAGQVSGQRAPHRHAGPPQPSNQATPPSPGQARNIAAARSAVIARDHACKQAVNQGQTLDQGRPPNALLSMLAVMRRPAPPADQTLQTLYGNGFDAGQEVFVNYVRRAREQFGRAFYVIPVGHVTPFGAIPARCYREFRGALAARLRHASAKLRSQTLAAQAAQLTQQRVQTEHQQGICFASVTTRHVRSPGGVDMGCTPDLSSLRTGIGESLSDGDRAGGTILAGVVADNVATITLKFEAGGGDPARTLTSRVVDNVFVIRIPRRTHNSEFPAQIIDRTARGSTIAPPRLQMISG